MRAALLSLALVTLVPLRLFGCDDNNPSAPDPPPWDLGGDGSWGSNGDGSFTDIGDQGDAPQGYTPPPAPSVQWLSLPPGTWAAGSQAPVEATGTDSAGILQAVSIDQSSDGGATWTALAYAGASGASGEADGGVTAQAGTTYQFRTWATDSAGQVSPTLYSSVYSIPAPPSLYVLSVSAVGPGSVSSSGGTYTAGTSVSVAAIPDSNALFEGWSGDLSSAEPSVSFSLNGSMNLIATFQTAQATLTVSTQGSGSASGSGSYPVGSRPAVAASPADHWAFAGWSPAGSVADSHAASTTALLDSDLSLTAVFTPALATLSTSVSGAGQVSGGGTYPFGGTATVSASPGAGYRWVGWSGDLSGTADPATLAMDGDKQVTANFATLLSQTISVAVPPAQLTTAPPLSLSVSASSGLPVSLILVSGPATLAGSVVTLSGQSGTVSLSASQAGNATYVAATPVVFSFQVTAPPRGVVFSSGSAASRKNDPKTPVTDYQPSHP